MEEGNVSVHSMEELQPLLAASKISLPNLLPEVQCVSFAEEYGSHETVLMEVTEAMLAQLEQGAT